MYLAKKNAHTKKRRKTENLMQWMMSTNVCYSLTFLSIDFNLFFVQTCFFSFDSPLVSHSRSCEEFNAAQEVLTDQKPKFILKETTNARLFIFIVLTKCIILWWNHRSVVSLFVRFYQTQFACLFCLSWVFVCVIKKIGKIILSHTYLFFLIFKKIFLFYFHNFFFQFSSTKCHWK